MSSRRVVVSVACLLFAALAISVRLAVAMPAAQKSEPGKPPGPDAGTATSVDNVTELLTATQALQLSEEPAAPIMAQDFEGVWPATGWELADTSTGDGGEYLWGKRTCHARTGSYAGWSVGGGAQGSALSCPATYPHNAYTWAIFGPFDLRGATAASLSFYLWGQTEGVSGCPYDYFFVGSSTDGQQFNGSRFCGDWTGGPDGNGYHQRTFDLAGRLGQSQVWVGFLLKSDFSVAYNGITIDDVSLSVSNGPEPTDTPTITPTSTLEPPPAGSQLRYLPVVGKQATATPTPTPTSTPTATPTATRPPTRRIAFRSNRDGNAEIYSMNANGSQQMRLTNFDGYDYAPAWSPDGLRLAFYRSPADSSYSDIFAMNANGTGITRLTTARGIDTNPSWSPTGSHIAFQFLDFNTINWDIYVMRTDGSGRTRLTTHSAIDADPSWSPDGSRIVFYSDRSGNYEIYVMNADGSGQTRLTNHPAYDSSPAWSPDGSKIAFFSDRNGNRDIYVMNANGTGVTRLTSHSEGDFSPTWSPDGSKIAFSSNRDGNLEIYVMNADGSGQVNVTNHPEADSEPTWYR